MESLLTSLISTLIILGIVILVAVMYYVFWTAFFVPIFKHRKYDEEVKDAEKKLHEIQIGQANKYAEYAQLDEDFDKLYQKYNKLLADNDKLQSEMQEDKLLFKQLQLEKTKKEIDKELKNSEKK